MNMALESPRSSGWPRRSGGSVPAGETAAGSADERLAKTGSYGRGVYAGRSAADRDFGPQGSFGSGV